MASSKRACSSPNAATLRRGPAREGRLAAWIAAAACAARLSDDIKASFSMVSNGATAPTGNCHAPPRAASASRSSMRTG